MIFITYPIDFIKNDNSFSLRILTIKRFYPLFSIDLRSIQLYPFRKRRDLITILIYKGLITRSKQSVEEHMFIEISESMLPTSVGLKQIDNTTADIEKTL